MYICVVSISLTWHVTWCGFLYFPCLYCITLTCPTPFWSMDCSCAYLSIYPSVYPHIHLLPNLCRILTPSVSSGVSAPSVVEVIKYCGDSELLSTVSWCPLHSLENIFLPPHSVSPTGFRNSSSWFMYLQEFDMVRHLTQNVGGSSLLRSRGTEDRASSSTI